MITTEQFWLSIGFLGQGFFFSRFLVQWIASERRRESVIPVSFWFFSIGGGAVLLCYAIRRSAGVLEGRRLCHRAIPTWRAIIVGRSGDYRA